VDRVKGVSEKRCFFPSFVARSFRDDTPRITLRALFWMQPKRRIQSGTRSSKVEYGCFPSRSSLRYRGDGTLGGDDDLPNDVISMLCTIGYRHMDYPACAERVEVSRVSCRAIDRLESIDDWLRSRGTKYAARRNRA